MSTDPTPAPEPARPWRIHDRFGKQHVRGTLGRALWELTDPHPAWDSTPRRWVRVTRAGWEGAVEAAGRGRSDGVRIVAFDPDGSDPGGQGNAGHDQWKEAIHAAVPPRGWSGEKPFIREDPDDTETWK